MPFHLTIVSPNGKAFEGDADIVIAPGAAGQFGVLQDHAPMIAAIQLGTTKVTAAGREQFFVTGRGVVEVENNKVVMLAVTAEPAASAQEADALCLEKRSSGIDAFSALAKMEGIGEE